MPHLMKYDIQCNNCHWHIHESNSAEHHSSNQCLCHYTSGFVLYCGRHATGDCLRGELEYLTGMFALSRTQYSAALKINKQMVTTSDSRQWKHKKDARWQTDSKTTASCDVCVCISQQRTRNTPQSNKLRETVIYNHEISKYYCLYNVFLSNKCSFREHNRLI